MSARIGKGRSGFTLIEVIITIVILFVVLDAVMLFFLNVMAEFRRQGKITETGIETVIGLEVLRKDVEGAGYGLPWNHIPNYLESKSLTALNDNALPSAPRPIINSDASGADGSDILVVKSVSVGTDDACRKWTTLQQGDIKRTWGDASLNFLPTDRVLVLGTGTSVATQRYYEGTTTYNSTSGFAPGPAAVRLIHGLTDGPAPRMPFNRAEYFIDTTSVPALCAPGTGVLVKSVIANGPEPGGGVRGPLLPLLDCVRDFQIAFGVDTTGLSPAVDCVVGAIADNTAAFIRGHLRDVRISILAQEGARDASYTHPEANIFVGYAGDNTLSPVGVTRDMSTLSNYRWKVYNLVVRPSSMR
jgi:prepilin-type N-terminal cleavage/methylation domain-containing protein